MVRTPELCSLRTTGGDLKGSVLDDFKFFDIGHGSSRSQDWGGVVYDGADNGVVGEGNGRFVTICLVPMFGRQGLNKLGCLDK